MDWINKNYMIIEKMKNQLHAKQIDSLDKIYSAIVIFDAQNQNTIERIKFENFLATIGIFLKTQELNEMHKYLYTFENNETIYYEDFISLLKVEVPSTIINTVTDIFLSMNSETINKEDLKKRIIVEKDDRVKLMQKSVDQVYSDWSFSIDFVAKENGEIGIDEFLMLHSYMYYVQPKENLTNFLRKIFDVWGVKRNTEWKISNSL